MAYIKAISYYLPQDVLSNDKLNALFPDWSVDKIAAKTGIIERKIAAENEYASDMAVKAARKLFSEHYINPESIDFVLLCTQSPDYLLPTTACIVQNELGIPTTAGALDYNLGCSGYVYGLSVAKGLIATGDAKNILLITSETYSKHLSENDKSVRTIFGDAAAATLISDSAPGGCLQRFAFGTDGAGAKNLISYRGGMKGNEIEKEEDSLYMNGGEIFTFTLKVIPALIDAVLLRNNMQLHDVDLFVFHQANKYMLDHLRKKMNIKEEDFFIHLATCGNTVSSTIPIALNEAMQQEKIKEGTKVLVAGFGVGYSWSAGIINF